MIPRLPLQPLRRTQPWLTLLTTTRLLGAVAAVVLLAAHHVTDYDDVLIVATVVWTPVSLAALHHPRVQASPAAWLIDALAGLVLVLVSGDWRSPFYVFALTTLVLPATSLRFRPAVAWGAVFGASYLGVALLTRRLPANTLVDTIRLETIAMHIMVPFIIAFALAYASELLRRLQAERERSERFAVQSERQRIAWELHDSAKQRVHAAHLVLSALGERDDGREAALVDQALAELRAAAADMDTSVAELRAPLDGRPVEVLLRERAGELARAGGADIEVTGRLPRLPPLVAAHTYRIAAEALTNAVRHAGARRITVALGRTRDGARVTVSDDGRGLPPDLRPGSHGLRAMQSRAETLNAELDIRPGPDGRGTAVELVLPLEPEGGRP